ncbi:MAG: CotH kinase family protein [Flavobacteriales bacterium]
MKKTLQVLWIGLSFILSTGSLSAQPVNELQFNEKSGFFTSPFNLSLSATVAGSSVYYTLDGSDPRVSGTAVAKTTPFTIYIDPTSNVGRDKTPGVVLRATIKTGNVFNVPVSRTFIFISNVKTQSFPNGSVWPAASPINQQIIDYNMDTKVTNSSAYKDSIDDALLSIPTLSVITSNGSLFNKDTGIYVNAKMDGKSWEREASVELIHPDKSEGFQIEAGLRIRGGYSREPSNPKHGFRLFFKSGYGASKLEFPLFGDDGVDEFDKIDLRCAQNYSWSYYGDTRGVMIRDIFNGDLQGELGQPHTRGHFYHLYINGMYWGIYQTEERPSASFGESYFGGDKEDYDVIKVETSSGYVIEATDGTTDAWMSVWNLCQQGFATDANYYKLQGLDATGKRDTALPVLVDIDNLIDYMLIIFYGGNVDAPVSEFLDNDGPNNFYAIYNRKKKNGFKFISHDAEHTLLVAPGNAGDGINENRVNIGTTGEMTVNGFAKFHPQWLHYKLSSNANYRIRFADHVYKHFYNDGKMTEPNLRKIFSARAREIETAVIAESARWGDSKTNPPRTKQDDWLKEVNNILDNYFPYRGAILLNQLKTEGLYRSIEPPLYSNNSVTIQTSVFKINAGGQIKFNNPNSNGTIYYTLDGSDPRMPDKSVSSKALSISNNGLLTINNECRLKARVLDGTNWSALHELLIYTPTSFANIKITEIHYHPVSPDINNPGKDYEFIEIKNTGNTTVNLTAMSFSDGIYYDFHDGDVLAPGAFIVLANKSSAFESKYGFKAFDNYHGDLKDGGENVLLSYANGDTIAFVSYGDSLPWPIAADGFGPSLVPMDINPTGDQNVAAQWRISYFNNGGSPGKDDISPVGITHEEQVFMRLYPNPAASLLNIDIAGNSGESSVINIYSTLGQSVYSAQVNANGNTQVDISSLESGLYLVKLNSGQSVLTQNLIKFNH